MCMLRSCFALRFPYAVLPARRALLQGLLICQVYSKRERSGMRYCIVCRQRIYAIADHERVTMTGRKVLSSV